MAISFNIGGLKGSWKWLYVIPAAALAAMIACSFIGLAENQSKEVVGYIHEILIVCAGFVLFFLGFGTLRKKWLIDNTPTSKIRSVAMGAAELCGKAVKKCELFSRLTRTPCVFFKFLIEKEVRDSKGRASWKVIDQGTSSNYFYLEDETGRILVDPLEAETFMPRDYRVVDTKGGSKFRYSEWHIQPGQDVYIYGTVKKFKDTAIEHKDKLLEKLRELKANKEKLLQFDDNKDGQIGADEWDRAVKAVENELLQEELKNHGELEDDIVVAKGELEKTFILSDEKESQISTELLFFSSAFVIMGIFLVVGMSVSVIARFGLLPETVKIPWEMFYKD